MKTRHLVFAILAVFFLFTACEKDNGPLPDAPELEWIPGGTTTTFLYSSGVLTGFNFHRSFTVSKKSGEVTVAVQIEDENDTKVTGTFEVEEGKTYSLKVRGNKSGSQNGSPGGNCFDVVFSSPNSSGTQEIGVSSYQIPGDITGLWYCPKTLVFGDISITE